MVQCRCYSAAGTWCGGSRCWRPWLGGEPNCQTSLLTPLIVTTHNFCKLVSLFFYEWKRKKANFKLLKQRCQFCRLLKNLILWANQKLPFLKRVSIKTSHKFEGNAKSHSTAKCRKQSNLWMVRIGQDVINQRTAESSFRYLWCWISWGRSFFYDFFAVWF